jgi:hypothetical protein
MNEVTLNRENLGDVNATFALGSLVGDELYRTGQAFIFFNIFGEVQLASKEDLNIDPPLPLPLLDQMPINEAVEKLITADLSEDKICNYLQNRSKRELENP